MNEREALLEVERLGRQLVDDLDRTNVCSGECDTACDGYQECRAHVQGSVKCPKCGEPVDFEEECKGVFECDEVCSNDVALDLPDEDGELLKQLRLALVQLDLARAKDRERFDDPMYGVTK